MGNVHTLIYELHDQILVNVKESQSSLQIKSLMRALEDPNITTVTQAYEWVIKDLHLTPSQRPGLRRAKSDLLKKLKHALEVLS